MQSPEIAMRSLQTLRRATRAPLLEVLALVASVCALSSAAPAMAETPSRPAGVIGAAAAAAPYDPTAAPSMRLSYQDLNLTTPQGIAALYLRIRHAALQVCETTRNTTGTRVDPGYDRCVQGAVAATVKQIGSPGLAALELEQRVLGDPASGVRNLCERPGRARLII